ncbi:hypothetical protein [Coralloluteibacterium stylophorae]|uniref:Outer membrane protein assembly factor BamE n=1 Tax=Coralloluteibacterium stylophorae TaxID=1776034 RepID=A0A8J7VSG5_9GAMM|nr:hypothetical protein [Coralloluteibacterium stylophorae]MBS7456849.1 hypothetical protein [Coralloluteibacterium stylophorae]
MTTHTKVRDAFAPVRDAMATMLLVVTLMTMPQAMAADVPAAEKYSQQYVLSHIVIGTTTREQVRAAFGEPHQSQGGIVDGVVRADWTYYQRNESMQARTSRARGFLRSAAAFLPGNSETRAAINDANYEVGRVASNMDGMDATNAAPRTLRVQFDDHDVVRSYQFN